MNTIKKSVLFVLCFLFQLIASAQTGYDYKKINALPYRSPQNPFYWQNRMPDKAYWQQDVLYKIDALLNDTMNKVTGKEHITYFNNSPDTLHELYLHLYQNAFQPGSYYDKLNRENGITPRFGFYEKRKLNTEIKSVKVNKKTAGIWIDNTIMKVFLDYAIAPGDSVALDIDFNSYFDNGSMRRRMKLFTHDGVKHFDCVHWYPRICVYDRKSGWNTDQHLDKEFYGDYGKYDVNITIPSYYVLDGTGILQNPETAMPDELREKLDVKNFANDSMISANHIGIDKGMGYKTWHFTANNVHDFAFTADPSYRIGETWWNGIKCEILVQEQNAPGWQNSADYVAEVVKIYSRDFGLYIYPKIIAADARDGMEYPMLTLDGGMEPTHHGVIAHEVGHNWFFGQVGNNETYRAFLDEGFTQFIESWSMERIEGYYAGNYPDKHKYINAHKTIIPKREKSVYGSYIRTAIQEDETTLNTHSSDFNSAIGHGGGYGLVYYKTATMLYNLQYVLGDSLFRQAMHHYFEQWKTCHPYPEDFRNSISRFTHCNLNWFFDEWLETSKTCDYEVQKIKLDSAGYYSITLKRNGKMQMPIDFTVFTKNGKKLSYYIPNTYFQKSTSATTLPHWYGWDKLQPTYTAHIKLSENDKIKNVIIDTTYRLADMNVFNNSYQTPTKIRFDWQLNNDNNRREYPLNWRPDLWYNDIDGIKAGLHAEGSYFGLRKALSTTAWLNQKSMGKSYDERIKAGTRIFNYTFYYRDLLPFIDKDLWWSYEERVLDGLIYYKVSIDKTLRNNNSFNLNFKSMYREDSLHLIYPKEWDKEKWNNTFNATFTHSFNKGSLSFGIRTSAPGSYYDFSQINSTLKHTMSLPLGFLKSRINFVDAYGKNIPRESQLFFAGANPEEMMENKYFRSTFGNLDYDFGATTGHIHSSGGLNMRGYSGYLLPYGKDTFQVLTYHGNSGISYNGEFDFTSSIKKLIQKIFRLKNNGISRTFAISTYGFFDAGVTTQQNNYSSSPSLANPRLDAGFGSTFTIKKWGILEKPAPFVFRFDMPLYLSHAPFAEGKNVKFRWIIGVGRAF